MDIFLTNEYNVSKASLKNALSKPICDECWKAYVDDDITNTEAKCLMNIIEVIMARDRLDIMEKRLEYARRGNFGRSQT